MDNKKMIELVLLASVLILLKSKNKKPSAIGSAYSDDSISDFRKKLMFSLTSRVDVNQQVLILRIFDKMVYQSQKDENYNFVFVSWVKGKRGYSTIILRELCAIIGYKYLESLAVDNAIDFLDSVRK